MSLFQGGHRKQLSKFFKDIPQRFLAVAVGNLGGGKIGESGTGVLFMSTSIASQNSNASEGSVLANAVDFRGLSKIAGEKWGIPSQQEQKEPAIGNSSPYLKNWGILLRGIWIGHELANGRKDPLLDQMEGAVRLCRDNLKLSGMDSNTPAQVIPLPDLDTFKDQVGLKKLADSMGNPIPSGQKKTLKRTPDWEDPPLKRLFTIPIGTPEDIQKRCAQTDDALRKFFKEHQISSEVTDTDIAASPYAEEINKVRPSLAKRYLQLVAAFGNGETTEEETLNYLELIPVMPPLSVRKALRRVIWWRLGN